MIIKYKKKKKKSFNKKLNCVYDDKFINEMYNLSIKCVYKYVDYIKQNRKISHFSQFIVMVERLNKEDVQISLRK